MTIHISLRQNMGLIISVTANGLLDYRLLLISKDYNQDIYYYWFRPN